MYIFFNVALMLDHEIEPTFYKVYIYIFEVLLDQVILSIRIKLQPELGIFSVLPTLMF